MLVRNGMPAGPVYGFGMGGFNARLPAWLVGMSRADMLSLFTTMQAVAMLVDGLLHTVPEVHPARP